MTYARGIKSTFEDSLRDSVNFTEPDFHKFLRSVQSPNTRRKRIRFETGGIAERAGLSQSNLKLLQFHFNYVTLGRVHAHTLLYEDAHRLLTRRKKKSVSPAGAKHPPARQQKRS